MDTATATKKVGVNGRGATARQLYDDTRRVGDELTNLAADARRMLSEGEGVAREHLTRQPYVTLAIAAGVGYVLGGGLPRGVLRLAMGVFGRLAVERALAQVTPRS